MAFHELGDSALDYAPCRYGESKLLFRGPRRRLDTRYVAMLGGTETYGKFVANPYPELTEELLAMPVVNFGQINAGVDAFLNDATLMKACSDAAVTVVQISGAQNLSNRFYAVHPRRNDRFLRASTLLKTLYRDVDFTDIHFTRHLLTKLKAADPEAFGMVEAELKAAWVARMKTLMSRLEAPVVLLWMSDHPPESSHNCSDTGSDPLFVNREMLDSVAPYAADLLEIVLSPEEVRDGLQGLVFNEMEAPAARGLLGLIAHEKAARELRPIIENLI